jgi:hypothetical protein
MTRLVINAFRIAPQDESGVRGLMVTASDRREKSIPSEAPRTCASPAQDESSEQIPKPVGSGRMPQGCAITLRLSARLAQKLLLKPPARP